MSRKNGESLEHTVEAAIMDLLKKKDLEPNDRIKVLVVGVRWAAVKARITLPEHGSAFDEGDEVLDEV